VSTEVCPVEVADQVIGGERLALIAGPCVLEEPTLNLDLASRLRDIAVELGIPYVFKASYDKANRTSVTSPRGPGLEKGLEMLSAVKEGVGVPVLSDVHAVDQVTAAAQVLDMVQVPAFLSRQTDLIKACAATGLPMNIKRGQFVAPHDMVHAVEKARHFGAAGVLLTERGTSFGYNDLIVDMRGLVTMRSFAPVCFDATHAVQFPGGSENASAGDSSYVAPLARAAVAVGIDALFIEIHAEPEIAPCDGQCQLRTEELDRLLGEVCAIRAALTPGS
jgi:2-dehydro-3-deoxyphosphooctonate aldolase (KDO 8-P synthase)